MRWFRKARAPTVLSEAASYAYDFDVAGEGTPAVVARLVGRDRDVLDVGAGSGSIAFALKDHYDCRVHAVEREPHAVAILESRLERVYAADLDAIEPLLDQIVASYDAIVLADVLEHLYDPWTTLARLKTLLRPDGAVVVSLPHVGHASVLATILAGDFRYMDKGLLDKTHIRFFCARNVQALIEGAGLEVEDVRFILAPPGHDDLAPSWTLLPRAAQEALTGFPMSYVYQFVVRARLAGTCAAPLDISAMSPDTSSIAQPRRRRGIAGRLRRLWPK